MAQAPSSPDIGAHFVRQIVTDPKNVPDVMLLYGYPGASSEEGHERLYLSPDLSNYVEVPQDAILHRAPAPKEQDPNGGVTLWVKKDAKLQYKMAPAQQAMAQFFAGAIAGQGVGGAAAPQAAAVTALCATRGAACNTHAQTCACSDAICPTDFRCATDFTPCLNTHANTCRQPCPPPMTRGGCISDFGGCTFIGCGHTLACTNGLLCAAGPAAPQPMAAQAAMAPQPTPPLTVFACTIGFGCGVDNTVVGPCAITRQATCGGGIDSCVLCPTHRPPCTQNTCAPQCTVNTCGIACTVVAPCPTLHNTCPPAICNQSIGIACTIVPPCPTLHNTCGMATCAQTCFPNVTCGFICHTTADCPSANDACPSRLCNVGAMPGAQAMGGAAANVQIQPSVIACPTAVWQNCQPTLVWQNCNPHTVFELACQHTIFGPNCGQTLFWQNCLQTLNTCNLLLCGGIPGHVGPGTPAQAQAMRFVPGFGGATRFECTQICTWPAGCATDFGCPPFRTPNCPR